MSGRKLLDPATYVYINVLCLTENTIYYFSFTFSYKQILHFFIYYIPLGLKAYGRELVNQYLWTLFQSQSWQQITWHFIDEFWRLNGTLPSSSLLYPWCDITINFSINWLQNLLTRNTNSHIKPNAIRYLPHRAVNPVPIKPNWIRQII